MSPPEGTQEFINMIEGIRDPTHNRALTPKEWEAAVIQAGFEVTHKEMLTEGVTLEKRLYPVEPDTSEAEAVGDAWRWAPQNIRNQLKTNGNQSNPTSWWKHRIVLVAREV